MSELVNYYYDVDRELTHEDDEGCLVAMCRDCRYEYPTLEWAGEGDDDSKCYDCDACNNPEHKEEMAVFYESWEALENHQKRIQEADGKMPEEIRAALYLR